MIPTCGQECGRTFTCRIAPQHLSSFVMHARSTIINGLALHLSKGALRVHAAHSIIGGVRC